MRHVARCRWLLRQRASRPVEAPVHDADELDDMLEPLLVEVVDRVVAKELPCHEQSSLHIRLATAHVG